MEYNFEALFLLKVRKYYFLITLYIHNATKFVTAQIDALTKLVARSIGQHQPAESFCLAEGCDLASNTTLHISFSDIQRQLTMHAALQLIWSKCKRNNLFNYLKGVNGHCDIVRSV